jgi:ferrous iron transport protein B
MNLRLVLELKQLGRPLMVALNMADVARAEGLAIDVARLSPSSAARWWRRWR